MKQLFANMLDKRKWINVNIGILSVDICFKHTYDDVLYGYKSLKGLYLNGNNEITWKFSFFISMEFNEINIQKIIKIQNNGFKCSINKSRWLIFG